MNYNPWKDIALRMYDESDTCHYDRHGYCQEHWLHEKPCPMEQISSLLDAEGAAFIPKALTRAEVSEIRGKARVGNASTDEVMALLGHIESLEDELDESDNDDTFGTEGWRHAFGIED